jgi:hypothetical protein
MRKIKNPKLGEYVMLTKWADKDPKDPWRIGYLCAIEKRISKYGAEPKKYYQCFEDKRWYRHCFRLTQEEGIEWISLYENKPTNGE